CAAPLPRLGIEAAQHGDGRTTLRGVGLQQIIQRPVRAVRRADVVVLLEAGERRSVAAADSQRAIGKYLFAVGDMPEYLQYVPILRRWASQRLCAAQRSQQRLGRVELCL